MKSIGRFVTPLMFALVLLAGVNTLAERADAANRLVCPPCGSPCDTTSFGAPGKCPTCGMKLVDAEVASAQSAAQPPAKKVAILVFNGCEILDFSGPYEMFGAAGCDVYTVAENTNPVTTGMGLTVVPKFSFTTSPPPDVLVIPGGSVTAAAASALTLEYIKSVTASGQHTMSVCNGAFILANTGLLDGLSATTTYGNIRRLTREHPKIKVVRDQRYVDNGKIITAAGLSAGMDGALHVIEKLLGAEAAKSVALSEEYDWKPNGGYVRTALADFELPIVDMDSLGDWNVVHTVGDANHWDIVLDGSSKLTPDDLMGHIEQVLANNHWTSIDHAKAGASSRTSRWRFTGSDNKSWNGTLQLTGAKGGDHDYTAALSIARAD